MVYKAPRVIKEYCKCESGQRIKDNIKKQTIKDPTPVWELLSL